jgi:hypothetical protein
VSSEGSRLGWLLRAPLALRLPAFTFAVTVVAMVAVLLTQSDVPVLFSICGLAMAWLGAVLALDVGAAAQIVAAARGPRSYGPIGRRPWSANVDRALGACYVALGIGMFIAGFILP